MHIKNFDLRGFFKIVKALATICIIQILLNMLIDFKLKISKKGKKGSMAELVDAPDSKSGHFGGVGSIPSTPTKNNCDEFS